MTTMTRRQFLSTATAAPCVGLLCCLPSGDDVTLQGSGATFPAPLYKRWFLEYYRAHPEVRVNCTPIGSAAGIRQFTSSLVSFGASDADISKKEVDKLPPDFDGVRLLPMTAGSIVLSYNLPGVTETVSPFENQKEIAWAAALVLVLLVLALNLGGHALSRRAFHR
jgi:ABC-type phosphate transport system substrate-binding protein